MASHPCRVASCAFIDLKRHIVLFWARLSPLNGEQAGLKEFLIRILPADVLFVELGFDQLLDNEVVAWNQLLFGVPRIEHERVILNKENSSVT